MENGLTLGILDGTDFTRPERGGGASGFISNIVSELPMNVKIFGIGYGNAMNWQEVPILPNTSFIPIANLNYLSTVIPRRFPTLCTYFLHRKRILESGVEALYVHSPECALPFVIFNSQIPVIFHQHGSANPLSTAKFRWARNRVFVRIFDEIHRIIYRHADWIIAIDRPCLNQAIENGAGPKVSLIMNSVDTSIFKPDEAARKQARERYGCTNNEFIALFAGRLEEVKRVDRIIESLEHLSNKVQVKLIVAGDGTLRRDLENQVAAKGLKSRVVFLGYVPHNQLSGLYNMADVLLLPSLMEGTPMVVLEALACGTPAIATRVGGIPDLIEDGKNGILLDDPQPQRIADAITRIAQGFYDWSAVSDSVSCWRSENVAKMLFKIFSELVRK